MKLKNVFLMKRCKIIFFCMLLIVMTLQGIPCTKLDMAKKVSATSKSASEAMSWVKSQVGHQVNGGQCVGLITAYYSYLGVAPVGGNGGDYATNALPAGWSRVQGGSPQMGDILVYSASAKNQYGHVAIYESAKSTYHQNYNNIQTVQHVTNVNYNGFTNPYWGYIRPNWSNTPTPQNPEGCLDWVEGRKGAIKVHGWGFDRDNTSAAIAIHVYIGGPAGDPKAEGHPISANKERTDVDLHHSCGAYHGFDDIITTAKRGQQEVWVYAINIGSGENVCLGNRKVAIYDASVYLDGCDKKGYMVACRVDDPSVISSVRCASWELANAQDDLKWRDMSCWFDGNIAKIYVPYSEHGVTDSGVFANHIYINGTFAGSLRHYLSKQTISDGTYHITLSANKSYGIDIAGRQEKDKTNAQLYKNAEDDTQTFDVTYLGDGYYKILLSGTDKSIEVATGNKMSEANLQLYSWNNSDAQKWMIAASGDGCYNIVSKCSDMVIDVSGGVIENGRNLWLYNYNGSSAQKWDFKKLPDSGNSTVITPTPTPESPVKGTVYVWEGKMTGWGGPNSYPSSVGHEQGTGETNVTYTGLTNMRISCGYECGLEFINPYNPDFSGAKNEMAQFIKGMQNLRIKVTLKNGGVASSWNWDTELSFPSGKEVALPDGYLENGYFALFGNDDVITKVEIYDVGQGGNQPTTSLKPFQPTRPTASSGAFQTATPSFGPVPSQTDYPSATGKPKVSPVKRQLVKTPGKVKIKKLKNSGKGRIKVTWKKVNCNEGYQVQYSRKRNFSKKTTRNAQGSSIYIYGKSKKVYYVYYVRVRAVNWGWKTQSKQGYKYGKWSNVKKIRIKLGSLSYFLHNSYC